VGPRVSAGQCGGRWGSPEKWADGGGGGGRKRRLISVLRWWHDLVARGGGQRDPAAIGEREEGEDPARRLDEEAGEGGGCAHVAVRGKEGGKNERARAVRLMPFEAEVG
jgi:hypothetical protein